MAKLILLVGPPGSGKSTYATQQYALYTYVNQDAQGKGHMDIFNQALLNKADIIVDRLNFNKEQRDRYISPAKLQGYETEIVVFHQNYDTCLTRCLKRTGHATIKDEKTAIKALNMFFTKYERVEDNEADSVCRMYPGGPKPLVAIFDLDGTMCNIDHRLSFIKKEGKKDWASFFNNLKNDTPNQWCVDILNGVKGSYPIVFCSGRPDDHKTDTMEWLYQYKLFRSSDSLFMRRRGDFRQDFVIKEVILDFELLTRFTPYFIIDDRSQVVEMWRRRGYTVLQCDQGDF